METKNQSRTMGIWATNGAEIIKQVTPMSSLDNGFLKIAQCYPTIEGNAFEHKHLHPEIEKMFEESPLLIERVITSHNCLHNAAFIVKACNNHDALVKALTETLKIIQEELPISGDKNLYEAFQCYDRARQLLQSIEKNHYGIRYN